MTEPVIGILIVEDQRVVREMAQEHLGGKFEGYQFEVATAGSVYEANEQMAKSRFNCVLLDIQLRGDTMSGIDLARIYRELDPMVGIILWTEFANEFYGELLDTGTVDACVVKSDIVGLQYAILATVRRKMTPYEQKVKEFSALQSIMHCKKAVRLRASLGIQTAWRLEGTTLDNQCIAWDIYAPKKRAATIGLTCSIGCTGRCAFCLSGERPLKRPLSTEEILAQFLHAMSSPLAFGFFYGLKKLKVNVTCEGDAMSSQTTLRNCCEVARMILGLNLNIPFIITTTGTVEGIRMLTNEYGELDITVYLSENFRDDNGLRSFYMPGARGSMISLRDALQQHSERRGKKDTISRMVIKDINDTQEDAVYMGELFGEGRPFKIKLMAMEPGSLKDVKVTTVEDVENFRQRLLDVGFNETDIRIKKIVGGSRKRREGAGCGTTVPRKINIQPNDEEEGEDDD